MPQRLIALAIGLPLAVMWIEVAGQTPRPLPGGPLPGITSGEFEEFRLGLADFTEVETVEDGLGPAFNGSNPALRRQSANPAQADPTPAANSSTCSRQGIISTAPTTAAQ